jgi:hypothetical protein
MLRFRPEIFETYSTSISIVNPTTPADGISIPASCTSFVAPVSTLKIHQVVSPVKLLTLKDIKAFNDFKNFETAYVVWLHNVAQLAAAKPTWTFSHPNNSQRFDNTRFAFGIRMISLTVKKSRI